MNKLIVGRIRTEGFITGLDCPTTLNSAIITEFFDTFKKNHSLLFFSTSAPINPDNNL
jgi:hypothetical protein